MTLSLHSVDTLFHRICYFDLSQNISPQIQREIFDIYRSTIERAEKECQEIVRAFKTIKADALVISVLQEESKLDTLDFFILNSFVFFLPEEQKQRYLYQRRSSSEDVVLHFLKKQIFLQEVQKVKKQIRKLFPQTNSENPWFENGRKWIQLQNSLFEARYSGIVQILQLMTYHQLSFIYKKFLPSFYFLLQHGVESADAIQQTDLIQCLWKETLHLCLNYSSNDAYIPFLLRKLREEMSRKIKIEENFVDVELVPQALKIFIALLTRKEQEWLLDSLNMGDESVVPFLHWEEMTEPEHRYYMAPILDFLFQADGPISLQLVRDILVSQI